MAGRPAHLGLGPLRDRTDHDRHAEISRGTGRGHRALRIESLEPAHRRQQDGQPLGAAQECV